MFNTSEQTIERLYRVGIGIPQRFPLPVRPTHRPIDPVLPSRRWSAKRVEDMLLALFLLPFVLLMMAAIVPLIRLDSRGPILFRQRRIGLAGREFEVLKFRTMHAHCAEPVAPRQATRSDKRVTRVGAWLRRFSLDELPQIFNVLRGDMSLVGPRPHAPGTCAGGRPFEQVVTYYPARHRVPPGITGLAQVRGWRGETDTEEKLVHRIQSDLEYIETWSIWLDLKILWQTLFVLVRAHNAY
jgi:lipopolysaccharide/colanic/teichoic acid biosynthesis glycosyltransferase